MHFIKIYRRYFPTHVEAYRLNHIRAESKYGYGIDIIGMKKVVYLLIILLMSAICSGCKTIKYYPLETVRHDTVYIQSVKLDSILVKDSVHITEKGDTVTEFRLKYIYKYKDRTDTLYLSRVDTVSVPYPVEKELTKWQSVKVYYGGWAIGLVFVFILIVVGLIVYKLKK